MAAHPKALTDCPLCEAPACFRWALVKELTPGAGNFVPTNWKGFAEYFHISLDASTPEQLVDYWIYQHPRHREHTIHKVFEFGKKRNHQKLQQAFDEVLRGNVYKGVGLQPQAYICTWSKESTTFCSKPLPPAWVTCSNENCC